MLEFAKLEKLKEKLEKRCAPVLFSVFVVASIVLLLPVMPADHDTGYVSSELKIVQAQDGNTTSKSYVNQDETVADAIDKGYATVQQTWDADGQLKAEYYFNADGSPAKRYGGYSGISYDYYNGSVEIKYLGADKQPTVLDSGYSAIVRTLMEGKAVDDYYYGLDMDQVQCTGGYYCLHREYDENGLNCRITYSDENGKLVINNAGYAIKTYQYDLDGTIIGEKYFDTVGIPVKSLLGQYGERYLRDKNGKVIQITYLDANGEPATTDAGYTILKRSYHRDGTEDTDMYFDVNGDPIALSKGQYGIKRIGKINLLLNRNGNIILCVDNILNGFPFMVVIFGLIICLLMLVLPKRMGILLVVAYVGFIFYETLMFRETGDTRTNFVLFSYTNRFLTDQTVRVGVINNIWLFVPLGTGLYKLFQKKWVLLIPLALSIAIEATQYVTGLGIAELDDVFGNTVGGWIGVLMASWIIRNKQPKYMAAK